MAYLSQLYALEELNVAYSSITNATMDRLVWSSEEEEGEKKGEGVGEGRFCPLLKKLKISASGRAITGDVVLRMVKSRKDGSLVVGGGGSAAIEVLMIEGRKSSLKERDKVLIREQVARLLTER